MLFLSMLILLVFFDKAWMQVVAIISWLIGLIANVEVWPLYLIATIMWLAVFLFVRWIVRLVKNKSNEDK